MRMAAQTPAMAACSSGTGGRRWAALLCLCLVAGGCALRHGGQDGAQEAEQEFVVGRWAFKRLEEVQQAVAEERYADAKEILARMQQREGLNPHERALMWQALAQVQAQQEDYKGAVASFEQCYALKALPAEGMRGVQYNLGQLYMALQDYSKAIEMFEAWRAGLKETPPEAHRMLASAYVQTGAFRKALPHAQALLAAEKPAKEDTLLLALAIRVELKQPAKAVALLKELISRFPKKQYWLQLSAAYAQLDDGPKALAALELAYRQHMLTGEAELMQLAYRYLHEELPLKAAELITEEMDRGRISRSLKPLEVLANSWMAAREVDKALVAYEEAAAEAKDGELYLRLARLYSQQERWAKAAAAAERALRKGDLEHPGNAYLLLGTARYHTGQPSAAKVAFTQARGHDPSRKAAEQWLEAMHKEQESCPTGREAACALIPGHDKQEP